MFSGKDEGFGAREALDPALASCVTLGKLLHLSGPQGPTYKREKHNAYSIMPSSKGILWVLNECLNTKHSTWLIIKHLINVCFLSYHHRLSGFKMGIAWLVWKGWAVWPELPQTLFQSRPSSYRPPQLLSHTSPSCPRASDVAWGCVVGLWWTKSR